LPNELALRVAIVGANDTGKTWLTHALAEVIRMRGQAVQTTDSVLRSSDHETHTPRTDEFLTIAQAQARTQAKALTHTAAGWLIADTTPLMTAVYSHWLWNDESLYPMALAHQAKYDLTLVTGLDWPVNTSAQRPVDLHARNSADSLVRQALERHGIAYRVVYGQGQRRLNNALLALGLPGEDEAARQMREHAQFAINQGRTVWQCNECSDPECEHRLFTGLLARRST
jgi:HTH-type transcriptional repressor of NAD biosynthesis genes